MLKIHIQVIMLHAKNLQLFLYRLLYACIMAIIIGTILIEGGGGPRWIFSPYAVLTLKSMTVIRIYVLGPTIFKLNFISAFYTTE